MIHVYRYQWTLALQLAIWSVLSIGAGLTAFLVGSAVIRGIGIQAVIWGVVEGVFAAIGARRAYQRANLAPDEYREIRDTVRLRRALSFNARLDLLYIVLGCAIFIFFLERPFVYGNGLGIFLQGLFLLFFDLIHARRLPPQTPAWYDPTV